MLPHSVTNFEIQKYYQNEFKFNGVYSRNNLSKIKDAAYIINLDEYKSIGTHWIASYVSAENVTYFDSFGVENIPKEIKKFTGNKKLQQIFLEHKNTIFRIQEYNKDVWIRLYWISFYVKRKKFTRL